MPNELQKVMTKFFTEAKRIPGAEDAVLEMSDEISNGVILSGKVYGTDTSEKLHDLGRKHGRLVLSRELNILYEKP